jgi:hypothetical protein
MSGNAENSYELVPELGDQVTFIMGTHSSTTGRIVYRDEALIRIRPFHTANRAIDFPLDPETGIFRPETGVTEIIIHEKAAFPHFARQVSVMPGERLEFYSKDGHEVAPIGVVRSVIATNEDDRIELEDGRMLDFGFIGPQPPIEVVVSRGAEDEEDIPPVPSEPVVEEEEFFPDIDYSLLPAALVEEIPTSERTYSDSVQREDMFTSLLLDMSAAKQKNPRVLRSLYRETDLLLAIKNSVILRDDTGGVLSNTRRSYVANYLEEVLERHPVREVIPSILPVVAVNRIVYTDDADVTSAMMRDVEIRSDKGTIRNMIQSGIDFEKKEKSEFGNPFLTYLDTILRNTVSPSHVRAVGAPDIQVDQDVLRSRMPPEPVEGFPGDLPPGAATGRRKKNDDDITRLYRNRLATIEDRSIRLLSASTYRNPKTGQIVQTAAADSGDIVGNILLSSGLSALRSPTRSSVLLWDVVVSEHSRRRSRALYRALMDQWDSQKILESDMRLADELSARLVPSLQIASRSILGTLDSLGLKHLELTEEILNILVKAIEAGRTHWDASHAQLKKRALAALQQEQSPIFAKAEDRTMPLWSDAVLDDTEMKSALKRIREREKTLGDTSAVRAALLSTETNATLAPLWYLLANQADQEAIAQAAATYRAERRRLESAEQNSRMAAIALRASPRLNTCKHVQELASVHKISDDAQRMLMLKKFIGTYRHGESGNWAICGLCKDHLVCRHELMLLSEFENPGRGAAIHKALLLEFSDAVFEGAYICKNCGQKVGELEYDNHVEFIDGLPAIGRGAQDEEGNEADMIMNEEGKEADSHGFAGDDLRNFYYARTLMEYCGAVAEHENYRRIVDSVRDFMRSRARSETDYEARRLQIQAQAKRGTPIPPPYKNYEANLRIGAIGALVVLEILTSNIGIPFPASGCRFRRSGFPLDETGDGAMAYVSCVLAGIIRNDAPWTSTTWSAATSIPVRQKAAESAIRYALNSILCVPNVQTGIAEPPLTTVTELYKQRIDDTRSRMQREGLDDIVGLASRADQVPSQFRPSQSPMRTTQSTEPITNVQAFMDAVETKAIDEIAPYVYDRQAQVIREAMSAFHVHSFASAKEDNMLSEGSPYSESVCCFQRIGVVENRGMGLRSLERAIGSAQIAEMELMETAAARMRRRQPERSCNGTHVMVPWSAPHYVSTFSEPDPSMYYMLFIKNCFRGSNMGGVHEFDETNACRFCQYVLPADLQWKTLANYSEQNPKKQEQLAEQLALERRGIAMQSFAEQNVRIDEVTFRDLEDAIRLRKTLSVLPPPQSLKLAAVLQHVGSLLDGAVLLPSAVADWDLLVSAFDAIESRKLKADTLQRKQVLGDFVARYDQMIEAVRQLLTAGTTGSAESRARMADTAMEGLLRQTDSVLGSQNCRNALNAFVVTFERIANGYTNERPYIRKWFPSYSTSHKELLDRIWERQAEVVRNAGAAIAEVDGEDVREAIRSVLTAMAKWLGPALIHWMENVREGTGITAYEHTIVVRMLILHALAALISSSSMNPVFQTLTEDGRNRSVSILRNIVMSALTFFASTARTYQMTAEQIKETLNARQELEKMYFIKKFDKLDPEMRQIELMKKRLKIGDWAVGTSENLFKYNKDFFEFRRAQRAEMGLPEFSADVTGLSSAAATAQIEDPYGFRSRGPVEAGYDPRAEQDEDM